MTIHHNMVILNFLPFMGLLCLTWHTVYWTKGPLQWPFCLQLHCFLVIHFQAFPLVSSHLIVQLPQVYHAQFARLLFLRIIPLGQLINLKVWLCSFVKLYKKEKINLQNTKLMVSYLIFGLGEDFFMGLATD